MTLIPYRILGASHHIEDGTLLLAFECSEGFFYTRIELRDFKYFNPAGLEGFECVYTWGVVYCKVSKEYQHRDYYIQVNSQIRLTVFPTTQGDLIEMLI